MSQQAFPELTVACETRVNEVLVALARLNSANGAIAARQLVRATRSGDAPTRRLIRRAMMLIGSVGVAA